MTVVTRFAPSPTGYLHIGGARTALFNYLYARHHGGKFLLRIEDTDQSRQNDDAVAEIFKAMDWLGITADADPMYQSNNVARHKEVAYDLYQKDHAYRCYVPQEWIEQRRQEAKDAGKTFRFQSPYRDLSTFEILSRRIGWVPDPMVHTKFVLRFKSPQEIDGFVEVDDLVQGKVRVTTAELDDFVILRADGSPTFLLAGTVDDNDMGVTHVIRGDDHLNNTLRQLPMIRALGWPEPAYAHIPLIHGPDGKKFSKRDGAANVMEYANDGFLPEAMFNYLVRLGWGHGNDEFITHDQAVEWFDIPAVKKAPSKYDVKKLRNLNAHYLRAIDNFALAFIAAQKFNRPETVYTLAEAMPLIKPRAQTLNEVFEYARFFVETPDVKMEADLSEVISVLENVPEWDKTSIADAFRAMVTEERPLKDIVAPVRYAITGLEHSPPLWESLVILGREESVGRLRRHVG